MARKIVGRGRDSLRALNEHLTVVSSVPCRMTSEQLERAMANGSEPWVKPNLDGKSPSLDALRSLEECVKVITQLAQDVEQCGSEGGGRRMDAGRRTPGPGQEGGATTSPGTQRSLEESRRLILQWAAELDKLCPQKPGPEVRDAGGHKDVGDKQSRETKRQRIMDWGRELQSASEVHSISKEEVRQILKKGLRKRSLAPVLPLLEFITWSLLREEGDVPQLWLSARQRAWKTGTPRYIPHSVWTWICSAAAEVELDPKTSHSWLVLSEENKTVELGDLEGSAPDGPQRFDSTPCVLAWEGFSSGRHYWEVDLPNSGGWKLGVTSSSSKRKGRVTTHPQGGYWLLWCSTRTFRACTEPPTELPLSLLPQVMGVYLDYEEGQVSFYNAETQCHIYTFSNSFLEKVYPVFAVLDAKARLTVRSPRGFTRL
ncbi:E3 ubiquitin-protein ligase TRIM39-like isoform X2 [Lepisosteus oculatus]|uniref:E3 ubiquitin-protein ligase TRIM39-like isoform X2 n=1 Tax=Lepisosteus oculatus TaxID=7918 RepID=UPI00370FD220